MSTERRDLLLRVVENVIRVRNQWLDSDTEFFTEELEQAFDELVHVFCDSGQDVPGSLLPVYNIVHEFKPIWEHWKSEARISNDPLFRPGAEIWRKIELIERTKKESRPRNLPPLESIQELRDQKVTDVQICDIYGFRDDDGRPDLTKLREEIAEPGRHTGPESGWEDPRLADLREQERRDNEIMSRYSDAAVKKSAPAQPPVAPESWEQLLDEGLSATQIADMKRCTTDDVYAMARELNRQPPPLNYELPTGDVNPEQAAQYEAGAQADQRAKETAAAPQRDEKGRFQSKDKTTDKDSDKAKGAGGRKSNKGNSKPGDKSSDNPPANPPQSDELTDEEYAQLETEIATYFQQGMNAEGIVDAMKSADREVSPEYVRDVLERFKAGEIELAAAETE